MSSRMARIGYILSPIEFGGSERVNIAFLRNVDRNRFDICPILLIRPWEKKNFFVTQLEALNYRSHKIPVAIRPRNQGRDYLRFFRCLKMLYDILSKGSFHLVHSHGYFADIIGTPVCKILRIPHISTCHGFISNDRNLKLYNFLDRFSLRFCDKVIAVSEGIKKDLVEKGINKSKIFVIQNAVQNSYNPDNFFESRLNKRKLIRMEENEYVVGYVGRLSDEKGLEYLIGAGLMLKERGEAFKILIIGDGPKRKELEDLVKEKDIQREVIFAGFQADVETWFPVIDVFVLPSLTEGTPMALLEVMATGIPAIATSVGGVPNIIEDGVNGILTDPADSKKLADKILTLAHNLSLSKKIAQSALSTIEKQYSVYNWCRKIEGQYDSLLDKNNGNNYS
jgi:glycosyltransferase involved in cell wall biosynthesis